MAKEQEAQAKSEVLRKEKEKESQLIAAERRRQIEAKEAEEEERARKEKERISTLKFKLKKRLFSPIKSLGLSEENAEFLFDFLSLGELEEFVQGLEAIPNERASMEKYYSERVQSLRRVADNSMIFSETKEEEEEIVTWTAEEVAALTRVLQFSPSVL